jgi:hypothetical protein
MRKHDAAVAVTMSTVAPPAYVVIAKPPNHSGQGPVAAALPALIVGGSPRLDKSLHESVVGLFSFVAVVSLLLPQSASLFGRVRPLVV